MKLGNKFKAIRYNYNMTQDEMANILEVNRNCLSRIENNKSLPNAMILTKLANEFNISIDSFLGINLVKGENTEKQIKKISNYCTYLDKKELDFISNLLSIMTNKKKI